MKVPVTLVSAESLARELGVSGPAVAQAKKSGRLTVIPTDEGDRFDLAVARIQWVANRKRQPASPTARALPVIADASDTRSEGSGYWDAKTRRETAEASIAELKEAELRGELVRKVEVERSIASRLVALRESLEVLADRLSALVAAEPDAQVCRRLLRDEHRKALATFAEQLETAQGALDEVA